jgi:hypothetical protein
VESDEPQLMKYIKFLIVVLIMGLSIHYSGYIKKYSLTTRLMEETADICNSLSWKYHLIDDNKFKGIIFSPPECEPVCLCFKKNRRMCSPLTWQFRASLKKNGLDPELIYTTSTKTQFAGIDIHIAIIKLLRYLSEKYFSEFTLIDEGNYWKTDDKEVLKKQFDRYNFLMDAVSDVLSNMKFIPGEKPESLVDRIERILKEKFGSSDE